MSNKKRPAHKQAIPAKKNAPAKKGGSKTAWIAGIVALGAIIAWLLLALGVGLALASPLLSDLAAGKLFRIHHPAAPRRPHAARHHSHHRLQHSGLLADNPDRRFRLG